MKKRLFILAFAFLGCFLTGCPDYSHLRDEPDWSKQGEGGPIGEDESEKTEEYGEQ